MSRTRMTTLAFLFLELFPFILFEIDSVVLCNSNTLSEYFDCTW